MDAGKGVYLGEKGTPEHDAMIKKLMGWNPDGTAIKGRIGNPDARPKE